MTKTINKDKYSCFTACLQMQAQGLFHSIFTVQMLTTAAVNMFKNSS